MNKYRQCMYTVILILTCLVASPFIFKQIWDTSSVKKPKAQKKEPSISIISDTETTAPTSETTSASDTETTTEAAEKTTEAETTTKAEETFIKSDPSYFDDALFIGDSRTVGIKEYGTLKNADYFCSVGLAAYKINTEYVDGYTLNDKLSSNEYGKIYIMLGINEVANDAEYTITAFRSLYDTIRSYQPDAIIYLEGNLHVTTAAQTQNITNDGINELNTKLSEMAEKCDNTYYIDINTVFDDETGALTPEYTSDGIHVLGKYYETWCDWFCSNTVSDGSSHEPATTTKKSSSDEESTSETSTEQYYDNGDTYNYDYSNDYNNDYGNYSGDNNEYYSEY